MIVVVGLSHRTAPLALRERLAVGRDHLPAMLQRLRAEAGLAEAMLLSTCNRVEVYGRGEDGVDAQALDWFTAVATADGPARDEVVASVYRLTGAAAIRHAFRVAASLESMVIGEPQILGQVKEAYQAAEEAGTLGST